MRILAFNRMMRNGATVVDLVASLSYFAAADCGNDSSSGTGNGINNSAGTVENGSHIHIPSTHVQLDEKHTAGSHSSFETHLMSITVRSPKHVADLVETSARLCNRGRHQQQLLLQQQHHKQQCLNNSHIRQLDGPGPICELFASFSGAFTACSDTDTGRACCCRNGHTAGKDDGLRQAGGGHCFR